MASFNTPHRLTPQAWGPIGGAGEFGKARLGLAICVAGTALIPAMLAQSTGGRVAGVLLAAVTLGCVGLLLHAEFARLTSLSRVDPVTGCLNRRGFAETLDMAVAQARLAGEEVSLLAIDLDSFKQVNDRFGHHAGDIVLRELGVLLRSGCRTGDAVARLGGEEFGIILRRSDCETAAVIGERLARRIRTHRFRQVDDELRVTVSVGIAVENAAGDRVALALRARADEALYAAKRAGRDRVLLWAPGVRSFRTPVAAA
jgi:diguanylate cyclase (GGDEF)-like protein